MFSSHLVLRKVQYYLFPLNLQRVVCEIWFLGRLQAVEIGVKCVETKVPHRWSDDLLNNTVKRSCRGTTATAIDIQWPLMVVVEFLFFGVGSATTGRHFSRPRGMWWIVLMMVDHNKQYYFIINIRNYFYWGIIFSFVNYQQPPTSNHTKIKKTQLKIRKCFVTGNWNHRIEMFDYFITKETADLTPGYLLSKQTGKSSWQRPQAHKTLHNAPKIVHHTTEYIYYRSYHRLVNLWSY